MIKQQINSAASALFTGILLFYTQSSFGDSVHLIMGNPEPQISSPGTDTQIMADAVFDAEGVSQEQITLYPDAEIQYSWFWEFNPGGKVTNVDADYFQQHEAITNPSPWLSVSTTNATGSFPLAGISSMNVTVWARVVVPSTGFISQPVKGTAAASTVSVGIGSITWTHSGGFIPGVWGNADCLPSAIGWVWEFTALPSPGGMAWPTGKPVWTKPSGSTYVGNSLTWPVTTVSDGGNIKCECGNHKKVKLIVVDGYKILAPTTCVPVGGKNVGLTLVKTIPDPNNPANYDISPWMGIWSMLPKGVAAVFYYHGAEYEGPLEFPEVDVEIKGKMPGTYVDVTATDNGTDVDTINLEIVGLNSITVSDK